MYTHFMYVLTLYVYVCMYTHVLYVCRTWRNAQFGEKVIIQMEEKSRDTAAQLKEAIGEP